MPGLPRKGRISGGANWSLPNVLGRARLARTIRPVYRLRAQDGVTLVELLVATTMLLVVVAPILTLLVVTGRTQARDQSYAQEVSTAQTALARLVHDLRGATSFQAISPGLLQFQVTQGGTTYNVKYDCTASDTLGSPYTRCARTQAVAPAAAPVAGSTPGPLDIQHIWNNPTNTTGGSSFALFCNTSGSAPSGSVFFVSNPNTANTDGSTAACDEAYETLVAALPTYIQIRVQVPASGDQIRGGLVHYIVLTDGAYLPNSDAGA